MKSEASEKPVLLTGASLACFPLQGSSVPPSPRRLRQNGANSVKLRQVVAFGQNTRRMFGFRLCDRSQSVAVSRGEFWVVGLDYLGGVRPVVVPGTVSMQTLHPPAPQRLSP